MARNQYAHAFAGAGDWATADETPYSSVSYSQYGDWSTSQPAYGVTSRYGGGSTASYSTSRTHRSSTRSSRVSSASSRSSAPSRHERRQPHQMPGFGERPATHAAAAFEFPCEFANYNGCQETFRIDRCREYVDHIDDYHLGNLPSPPILSCWFCDQDFRNGASEGTRNLLNRMHHVLGHFYDNNFNAQDMRPDFHFVEYLERQGVLTGAVLTAEQNRSDTMPGPPEIEGIHPYNWRPSHGYGYRPSY
jgi:hypothetical protein